MVQLPLAAEQKEEKIQGIKFTNFDETKANVAVK